MKIHYYCRCCPILCEVSQIVSWRVAAEFN